MKRFNLLLSVLLSCAIGLTAALVLPTEATAEETGEQITAAVGGSSNNNLCDYVAAAVNSNQLDQISVAEGTVRKDGKTIKFVVGPEGGTCGGVVIHAKGAEFPQFIGDDSLDGLDFADASCDSLGGGSHLIIIKFHNSYYTLEDRDYEVFDPVKGPVCSFSVSNKQTFTKNDDPKLCSRYKQGDLSGDVNWIDVAQNNLPQNTIGGYRSAIVSFDGTTHTSVIQHQQSLAGGTGAEETSLTLLQTGSLARSLESGQDMLSEANRDAELVQDGGKTYIDVKGSIDVKGKNVDRTIRSQILLGIKDGAFASICRIDQIITIKPVQP